MSRKSKEPPACHPDRPYYSSGLCYQCSNVECSKRRRKKLGKEAINAENRAYTRERTEAVKGYHLRWAYGLSLDDFKSMVKSQAGLCAICKKEKRLVVDHCHETGAVRKLLCHHCNIAIGICEANPDWIEALTKYMILVDAIKEGSVCS